MGISIEVTRVACNTSTGDQDITITGFGTPKAALFIASSPIADDTPTANAVTSVGSTDGTTQAVASGYSEDALAASNARRRGTTDEVVLILDPAAENVDGEANFKEWITDGVRITWGNAPSVAHILTVVLFGGSDLSAKSGNFTATSDPATTDVDCGFTPDLAFFYGNGTSLDDSDSASYPVNLGFASNATPIVNRAASTAVADATTSGVVSRAYYEDKCVANLSPANQTLHRSLYVSDFLSGVTDGFEITHNVEAPSNLVSAFLALSFGGKAAFSVGTMDTPTSTGNHAQEDPEFQPQFVMMLIGFRTNTGVAIGGGFGFSIFTESAESSVAVASENAVGTMNDQSLTDAVAVNLPEQDGTVGYEAAFVSMDASGWTLNFTAVPGTSHKWPYLAIGATASNTDDLTATDITTGTPTLEAPTIAQVHALAATHLTSAAPTIDEPVLDEPAADNLVAADITAATPTLDEPTIGQSHALAATALTSAAPTIDEPTIAQAHALAATDTTAGTPTLAAPTFAQVHALAAADIFFAAWNFTTPTLFAYTTTPADRTGTPPAATPSSAPASDQRTSVPY